MIRLNDYWETRSTDHVPLQSSLTTVAAQERGQNWHQDIARASGLLLLTGVYSSLKWRVHGDLIILISTWSVQTQILCYGMCCEIFFRVPRVCIVVIGTKMMWDMELFKILSSSSLLFFYSKAEYTIYMHRESSVKSSLFAIEMYELCVSYTWQKDRKGSSLE